MIVRLTTYGSHTKFKSSGRQGCMKTQGSAVTYHILKVKLVVQFFLPCSFPINTSTEDHKQAKRF